MSDLLFNKVYGCLLGGIVGDAMGAPAENMNYGEIEEKFGWIEDFEGEGTDDSAIKMILCEALLENEGQVTADEFAESFLRNKDKYYNIFYTPVRNMLHKVESKLSLPVHAGYGNMHSSSSAMSISPMGLVNACNPRQAAMETFDVAGLIHSGDSGFCRDGACAMAAAVAEAMKPAATVASILEASTAYLHKTSAREMSDCILETLRMAEAAGDYKKFRVAFYQKNLRDISPDSRETVPCALSLFYLSNGDPIQSIIYSANFGRDSDTIGTMAGALAGAYKGIGGLKPEWVAKAEGSFAQKNEKGTGSGESAQAKLARSIIDIIKIKTAKQKACIDMFAELAER